MPTFKRRLAVLISGSGTTLKNLIECRKRGELDAEIAVVISSRPDAGGLQWAQSANIPVAIFDFRHYGTPDAISQPIFELCRDRQIDWVVMGGFLRQVTIPNDFENRVINIHPSLIPAFCGDGMYGRHVHNAVIDYGCKVSGCTVHFVDNQFDHGPIIAQQVVDVANEETSETLAARIFAKECQLYPSVINDLVAGNIKVKQRHVLIER